MIRAKYAKRSICPCGFPVLKEKVLLGTWYIANEKDQAKFTFICGGCGMTQSVDGIWVAARWRPGRDAVAAAHDGYLPIAIFGKQKPL